MSISFRDKFSAIPREILQPRMDKVRQELFEAQLKFVDFRNDVKDLGISRLRGILFNIIGQKMVSSFQIYPQSVFFSFMDGQSFVINEEFFLKYDVKITNNLIIVSEKDK
jgi:hypothetical protein